MSKIKVYFLKLSVQLNMLSYKYPIKHNVIYNKANRVHGLIGTYYPTLCKDNNNINEIKRT